MTIQEGIDNFLRSTRLRTVTDMVYYPDDQIIAVRRKIGYRNVLVDVSEASSPSEAVEMAASNAAVY